MSVGKKLLFDFTSSELQSKRYSSIGYNIKIGAVPPLRGIALIGCYRSNNALVMELQHCYKYKTVIFYIFHNQLSNCPLCQGWSSRKDSQKYWSEWLFLSIQAVVVRWLFAVTTVTNGFCNRFVAPFSLGNWFVTVDSGKRVTVTLLLHSVTNCYTSLLHSVTALSCLFFSLL